MRHGQADTGLRLAPELAPMRLMDLDRVMDIEAQTYEFPWTRGNFVDSLADGHLARVLRDADGQIQGYFLAMYGVDEMHLLNISVAPEQQRRGWARLMLDALVAGARAEGKTQIWLEVRRSNARALQLYQHYGFKEVGLRRAYYPARDGREDALLFSLEFKP
ncbi:MAG: ribosomal protein S18-alanine N-acetyltransferase [Burkholderiaceae bacterium]|nr:ribosomal protein S18-alanine N-acetyltransferase [Roseateles sp.]MBV8471321.1 ribosomal protein S18-alanine N-acetyltransferase [Burkholderiaceae bacterium]